MTIIKDFIYHMYFFILLQLFVKKGGELEHSSVSINFYQKGSDDLLAYIRIEDIFNFELKVDTVKNALKNMKEIPDTEK